MAKFAKIFTADDAFVRNRYGHLYSQIVKKISRGIEHLITSLSISKYSKINSNYFYNWQNILNRILINI